MKMTPSRTLTVHEPSNEGFLTFIEIGNFETIREENRELCPKSGKFLYEAESVSLGWPVYAPRRCEGGKCDGI